MAAPTYTLLGVVANDCDVDNFDPGELDEEIFVEGTGSIGLKVSATTSTFVTTTLSTGPYDFSSGGGEEGFHIIIWFDALNSVNNFGIYLEEGTDNGRWTISPPAGYTGGFIPLIIDPTTDFSVVGGAWSTGGNPAQLDNVTGMGAYFDIAGSIMGNFHNALCDQFTVGEGIRVEDGDATTPATWDRLKIEDEDTNQYGWLRFLGGAYYMQGKVRIGPATGDNAWKFLDSDKVVTFVASAVATGFHEISCERPGTGTSDFDQSGMFINAEDPTVARWSLTVQDGVDYDDADSVYQGFDVLSLGDTTLLLRVSLLNGNAITQNGAELDSCIVRAANTADGVALITSDDPENIHDCDFTFSDGHAIEITTPGTYTFDGNVFTGYGSDDTNDAAIYNNSGGLVTLNIVGGVASPTVRNGAGASTVINNNIQVTFSGLPISPATEARAYLAGTRTEIAGEEAIDSTGNFVFSQPAGTELDIRILNEAFRYREFIGFVVPSSDTEIPVTLFPDPNYQNP